MPNYVDGRLGTAGVISRTVGRRQGVRGFLPGRRQNDRTLGWTFQLGVSPLFVHDFFLRKSCFWQNCVFWGGLSIPGPLIPCLRLTGA